MNEQWWVMTGSPIDPEDHKEKYEKITKQCNDVFTAIDDEHFKFEKIMELIA